MLVPLAHVVWGIAMLQTLVQFVELGMHCLLSLPQNFNRVDLRYSHGVLLPLDLSH